MKKMQIDRPIAQRPSQSKVSPIAAACATMLALSAPFAYAQEAKALDSVVITGIRKSLDSSVDLKRTTHGMVDGIVAEDIGKFPDTNLAESMQRIAGVSIDRAQNGEGNRVTVRGVGPDFNLVLLNGRQMPAAGINSAEGGSSANNSRAFEFSNLSSDSIASLEVFKTSRASTPTGGIGATVNIKTARPLDNKERVAAFSVKGNYDVSNVRLPEEQKASSTWTPEVSGIYSDTFADGTFGIAISGNYSKRNSGSNKAYVQNGWRAFRASGPDNVSTGWGAIPRPGEAGSELITNRPTGNTLYAQPVDLRYALTGMQRERTNGQITLQYAPTKDLKFTVDYTMANNTTNTKNMEMSTWFNFAGGPSTWSSGSAAAGPISVTNNFPAKDHDLAFNGGEYGQKAENRSTGFNVEWKVSNALKLEFDAHRSTAKTSPNSPYGTYSVIDAAMFSQGTATGIFNKDFPILNMPTTSLNTQTITVTGSRFDNALSDQTVEQQQFKGAWKIDGDNKLSFGFGTAKVNNRSANVNHQNGDWGGVGAQGDYAGSLFKNNNLPGYFERISGSDDPRQFQNFYSFDFQAVRNRAVEIAAARGTSSTPAMGAAAAQAYFSAYPDFTLGNDLNTVEKSDSAYLQFDHSFDTSMPMNISVGVRQEKTTVDSSSQVLNYNQSAVWGSLNEIVVNSSGNTFGTASGSYSSFDKTLIKGLLSSVDFDIDFTDNLKGRASYGENIGRPGWGSLAGGISVGPTANFGGGNGNTGNAALLPLLSRNTDLSLEYYYAKSSYVAGAYFTKDITNFIQGGSVRQSVGGVRTPIGGAYYRAATTTGGCATTDPVCQRKYIFANFNGQPGVTFTGFNATGEAQGTIVATASDPLLQFAISTPTNADTGDTLKGFELTAQHVFGNSGFGVSANYTRVTSGLTYDNGKAQDLNAADTQIALVGVSNSYNLVGFYEDAVWSGRAAYNWRDRFLASTTDGAGNNPIYTAPYGQLDVTLGYKWNKNLTLQADFINLNDGVIRQYGRTEEMLVGVTQTGRRYQVGARYRF